MSFRVIMWGLISVPCGEVIIAMRVRSMVGSLVIDRVDLEAKNEGVGSANTIDDPSNTIG